MPVLKALPEPRLVREGRTKVFEVHGASILSDCSTLPTW